MYQSAAPLFIKTVAPTIVTAIARLLHNPVTDSMQFFSSKDYQTHCQKLFEDYQSIIQKHLANAQIEHIGASAIPNCISKGDLDIYVAVNNVEQAIGTIEQLDFKIKQNTLRTPQLCMLESQKSEDVAIQLVEKGSPFEDFLHFRDKLRTNPKLVNQYNQMKLSCTGFTQEKYREVKSRFIEEILG
jgi:GrpB-like predicted nucleotidyltransferase (UPF0157 family)